jgi:hypothetical protein
MICPIQSAGYLKPENLNMHRTSILASLLAPFVSAAAIERRFDPSTDFLEFIGCDATTQVPVLQQAYIDAISNFGQVLGEGTELDWDNDKDLTDYFGKRTDGRAQIEPLVTSEPSESVDAYCEEHP